MNDPRDPNLGPTTDERVQIWSARHPITRIALLVIGLGLIVAGVLTQIFGK